MPSKSSDDTSNLPVDPLGSCRPTTWPPGTLQAYPLTPWDPVGLPLDPLERWSNRGPIYGSLVLLKRGLQMQNIFWKAMNDSVECNKLKLKKDYGWRYSPLPVYGMQMSLILYYFKHFPKPTTLNICWNFRLETSVVKLLINGAHCAYQKEKRVMEWFFLSLTKSQYPNAETNWGIYIIP